MALINPDPNGPLLNAEPNTGRPPTIKELDEILASGASHARSPSGDLQIINDGGALNFLRRCADGKHRIVSSGDLTNFQIADAQASGRFFVEPGGGLGWALLPWELGTEQDSTRENREL